ncbi:MAG: hypothetical protein HeimC2_15750 [Candidatus Heimdallarchaeota archaeon LC_2]|nr:MAG: hypothetical protein HeimC2_15750 [Candidatus Heimdallarchaeota archaeon LC_2]
MNNNVHCGTPITQDSSNCVRCFDLIPSNSKFCPYCTSNQQKISPVTPRPALKTKKVEPKLMFLHHEKLTKNTVTSSLRFDSAATISVISNERFSRISAFLIFTSGLFFALTFIVINAIFGEGGTVKEAFKLFIMLSWIHITILFGAVIITKFIFESLETHSDYKPNSRYFGIWAITLIVKDVLMYPTMIYVLIFEGKDGLELVEIIFITFTILVIAFLVIHTIVYNRSFTGYGYSLCVLLFTTTAFLIWFLTIYNTMLIRAFVDLL